MIFTFIILLGTNDIRGITLCLSALNDNTYSISCDYVSGCNFSGCFYNLTSMTDTISGKIEGNNFTMIEVNEVRHKTFYLATRDLNGLIVQSENITFIDNNLCPSRTGQDDNYYMKQQLLLFLKVHQNLVVLD